MPVYQYLCRSCGPFSEMKPMAESAAPANCPSCAEASPRTLSAPHVRGVRASVNYGLESRNEKSAHEPQVVRHFGRKNGHRERDGHAHNRNGLCAHHGHTNKSHRPWMVGH